MSTVRIFVGWDEDEREVHKTLPVDHSEDTQITYIEQHISQEDIDVFHTGEITPHLR
ncbi:MAG: hypothetical protein GY850_38415 [bacterium]|nr:hypothetical protein [bacterium]